MPDEHIQGGYILLARKMFDSWLMDKPPLYWKLWVWMLGQANWKDRGQLSRGQLVTTIADMQEAMSYKIGYRKKTPTKDEIRSAYEAFTNTTMITTAKTTRGMVVTVCNYDKYQDFGKYEAHNEPHNEAAAKPTVTPHDTERKGKQENKKELPYAEIVDYLNAKTGKNYRASGKSTKALIRGRFGDGFSLEDFKAVIDNKVAEWLGDPKMEQYLRPETLFGAKKFDGYRNQKPVQRKSKMDEVGDRLNAWAGGNNGTGMDQENDGGNDDGSNVISLKKLSTGQFGR